MAGNAKRTLRRGVVLTQGKKIKYNLNMIKAKDKSSLNRKSLANLQCNKKGGALLRLFLYPQKLVFR